jgi:hypothetical protein
VCAWGACNLVEWSTCGHTPPGNFTEIGVWNCDQLRSLRFHRARQEVWLCGFGDPGQHRDHGSWICRRAAREGTAACVWEQISVRSPTSFELVSSRGDPHAGPCSPFKLERVRVRPAAPAPHPNNDTPQSPQGQTYSTVSCVWPRRIRLSTCVTSTSDEKRVFAVSSHTRMWVCVLVPRGSLLNRGASTNVFLACTPLP